MNKKKRSKKRNDEFNNLDRQINEIEEWQRNAYNPGYYVGSGKIPLHLKNIFKNPIIMLVVGIIFLLITLFSILSNFTIESLLLSIIQLLIGSILTIGGIIRLIKFIYISKR